MIIGAGMGGLTAAIALRRSGIEATVFERASELREVGAGILLAANAVKALGELGISEKVHRLGTAASVARIRSWRGDVLSDIPAADLEKRVGAPSAAVHRADLQKLLLQELDEGNLRLGARFTGFRHDEEGVTAVFASGPEERGDVLIGADGLYSTVRTRLFGPEKPRYAGYTAWRAVVESDRELLPRGTGFESWGKGARFGCAHIGGGRVYWFATRNAPEGQKDGSAGTSTGSRATLTELFDGWHRPVAELISETDERTIRRDDLYDREPLITPWGEGRVTLLGDAAHPMTPNLDQGACQAIEDAVVLARCLREDGEADMPSALRSYEDARRERTAWILCRSRVLGRVGQIQDPLLCRPRDAILKATPVEAQLRLLERVMDHEERPATRRSVRWFA